MHEAGREARQALEACRRLGREAIAQEGRLIFTGSGTEANQLLLSSFAAAQLHRPRLPSSRKMHILLGANEHASVYAEALGLRLYDIEVEEIPIDARGQLRLEKLAALLRPTTALVAAMWVNNEFGSIQDLAALRHCIETQSKKNAWPLPHIHVDAVQGLGKLQPPQAFEKLASSISITGHKLGALRGSGALWLAQTAKLGALHQGGGQEGGLRSGTENLAAIRSLTQALANNCGDQLLQNQNQLRKLEAYFFSRARDCGLCVYPEGRQAGDPDFSPWIICCAFDHGLPAEPSIRLFAEAGFAIGAGSACHSKLKSGKAPQANREGQRLPRAYGIQDPQRSAALLRLSFGPSTRLADLEAFFVAARSFTDKAA